MVLITEELVRKKSEHNECIISTLEELSLHQEDVEKIEHLNNWCKDLQILYLQANLIPKIENLNKMKKLQYLNLALNNIEKVENLERCESLEKLDLTLNFIGDIESICSLRYNLHLKDLYLMGNPCYDFKGYREYVIANLPQLKTLDNKEILKSERLKSLQKLADIEATVLAEQRNYEIFRRVQKEKYRNSTSNMTDDEFWNTASENSPEVRIEISNRSRKNKNNENEKEKIQKSVQYFAKDGRPLNINQAKLKFHFSDEDPKEYVLDLSVYKYLDTNLIDVDVQPIYVKVLIKGKVFQLVLPEEVYTDKSTAQRSQTTGHLVIKMPRVNYKPSKSKNIAPKCEESIQPKSNQKHEFLDAEDKSDTSLDFSKIVENAKQCKTNERTLDFSDIPPLQYGF